MENTMYKLKKNNRTIRNAVFETYEKARQAARRKIRQENVATPRDVKALFMWDGTSRNPVSLGDFGYKIVRV